MQRVLRCDGIIVEKREPDNRQVDVLADDIREIKAYVEANRTLDTPFDIVINGNVTSLERSQLQDKLLRLIEAGATWWIEGLWEDSEEAAIARIRRGPPSQEM